MFESRHQKIAPVHIFWWRFVLNLLIVFIMIGLGLAIGMWGYHYFENMGWVDAYVNAAMILSGMGPVQELKTEAGKLFAGTYAIFSGIIFLFFMAVLFAPIFHRMYHQFHLKDSNDKHDD